VAENEKPDERRATERGVSGLSDCTTRIADWGPFVLYLTFVVAMIICMSSFGWTRTWSAVFVRTMYPPFADLRVYQGALISAEHGLNPQLSNPGDPWQRRFNQPRYWVDIARLVDLRDETRFRLIALALISCFVGICAFMLRRFPSYGLLACLVSASTLRGIERANSDLLIFCLVFPYALLLPRALSVVPILAATALKLYAVFALAALFVRRQFYLLAASSITALVIFAYLFDQFSNMYAGVAQDYRHSYGLISIAIYLEHLDAPAWLVAGTMVAPLAALLLLTAHFRNSKECRYKEDLASTLSLCGASIYVGTFIFAANYDYRLMFLILCLPHLQEKPFPFAGILIPLMLLAMNEAPLIWLFGSSGVAVSLSAKFAVFIVLCAWLLTLSLAVIAPRGAAARPGETAVRPSS